jgi:predicted nucleotidyltransferase
LALFESIFAALEASGSRYVVVGGVATVLHGHARLTADVDLIVDLERNAATALVNALVSIGFRPRAPVPPSMFADPDARADWVKSKGMRVFSLWDPKNPMREVDLFIEHPMPFEELWARSVEVKLDTFTVRIASIEDLIALKRLAGRPEDLQDIEALEKIRERRRNTEQ